MDFQSVWGTTHVVAALVALVAGMAVLRTPKGTGAHRALGAVYVVALVLVDVAALSLYREGAFGVFHGLAVVSLATLVVGLAPLLLGKRSAGVIANHAYCMTWSYAGLVAAGCGQLAAVASDDVPGWFVPGVIVAVLCISAFAIFTRVPPALDRVLVG